MRATHLDIATVRRWLAGLPGGVGWRLFAGHLLTVWGLALSNAFLGLSILWTAGARPWRHGWSRTAPLLAPLGVYSLFFLAAIATSLEPRTSLGELRDLLTLATLPLALWWVRGERAVRDLVDLLLAMMVVLAAYGILQYLITDYGPLDNRIPGPFSHYMTFSGVLLLGDFLLLGRMIAGSGGSRAARPPWRRPWNWIALVLLNTALLMTLTRGPWVALAVTFTAVLWLRARRFFFAYLAAAAVAGTLFATLAPASWTDRMVSIVDRGDASNYDRLCMTHAGFYMISERPLFGIGPAMVAERYPIYRHPTAPRYTVKHLHNTFVQLAAERGLLSLAAYLWLMAAALGLAWRDYRRDGGEGGPRADLYLGVLLALIGFNLAGLFEANWRDTEVQRLVLFLLAVPVALRADPS